MKHNKHNKLAILLSAVSVLVLAGVGVNRWHQYTLNRELSSFESLEGFQSWEIDPSISTHPLCLDSCSNGSGTFIMPHSIDVDTANTRVVDFLKDHGYTNTGINPCGQKEVKRVNKTITTCTIWGDKSSMKVWLDIRYDVNRVDGYHTVYVSVSY